MLITNFIKKGQVISMPFSKSVRAQMEKTIYDFFSIMDPSLNNTKKYQAFFGRMSDEQFKQFFDHFFKDTTAYLTLDIVGYEHEVSMNTITKAAKYLKVPLYETVMMPSVDDRNGKAITTKQKVPVGYIHMKTVQQMVKKKNSTSLSINKRDPRTGQVTGDDKDAQFAVDENFGLMALNAKNCLKEFMSMRADDMTMKEEGYRSIRKNGYVSLQDLDDDIENKTALNTLDTYFTSMHIKTDIVNSGYILRKNLRRNEE